MCGIAGYCLNSLIQPSTDQIERFLASIRKRGPDDEGIALISRPQNTSVSYRNDRTYKALSALPPLKATESFKHDIALLHTRYAILDLSPKGHQPFVSRDRSVTAVFNGEIYNYIELRHELTAMGAAFETQCDTEVLIEGYAKWKDALWPKLNGFWSVVLYDRRNQTLVLCRDRIGVAPLYYRETPQGLFFSSYIDTLVDINNQKASYNQEAITGFLETGFKDLDDTTFYSEIKSVPAATAVHVSPSQSWVSQAEQRKYWYLPDSRLTENDISMAQAVKDFRDIFFNAVEIRLRADVKVAFELSGGLDSSSVVAAAAGLSKGKITTYTARVRGADEEPYARSLLTKYNVDYHVIDKMEDRFAQDCLMFSEVMEEPYDNPNAYTHYQMLKIMKSQGAQVVVTGAGGDEVFAGYESSFWPRAYQEWRRQGLEGLLKADWHEFCRRFRTSKNAMAILKHYLVGPFKKLMPQSAAAKSSGGQTSAASRLQDQYNAMTFNEQRLFHFKKALLPFYMRSSDHFTMGIPIEHRFPLLDYRSIEFGLQLPISYLFRNGWTKYILRKAMEPYLPPAIIWRRQKMGFQFPFGPYLSAHRREFEPRLNKEFAGLRYQELLNTDPAGLWRFLSVAVWKERQAV